MKDKMKDIIKDIIPYIGVITLILIPVIAVLWIWNIGDMNPGFYQKLFWTNIIALVCLLILDYLID